MNLRLEEKQVDVSLPVFATTVVALGFLSFVLLLLASLHAALSPCLCRGAGAPQSLVEVAVEGLAALGAALALAAVPARLVAQSSKFCSAAGSQEDLGSSAAKERYFGGFDGVLVAGLFCVLPGVCAGLCMPRAAAGAPEGEEGTVFLLQEVTSSSSSLNDAAASGGGYRPPSVPAVVSPLSGLSASLQAILQVPQLLPGQPHSQPAPTGKPPNGNAAPPTGTLKMTASVASVASAASAASAAPSTL